MKNFNLPTIENNLPATKIDLHVHSVHSDGSMKVAELFALAAERNIKLMALTDHDTVSGIKLARKEAQKYGIAFVAGVEISAKFAGGACHLLGYFINEDDPDLLVALSQLKAARDNRNQVIIDKLQKLKLDITEQELLDSVPEDTVIGRPHIARLLIEKKYVVDGREAFKKYLGVAAAAYVDKELLTPQQAISTINASGALVFLAHPVSLRLTKTKLFDFVGELKNYGLAGIEVFNSAHKRADIECYHQIAKELKLLISGGSDFHGAVKPKVKLGQGNAGKMLTADCISLAILQKAGV